MKRSHNRIVFECYMALKKAEAENDCDKMLRIMHRYGRKTREDAIRRLEEDSAEKLGMSYEEYDKMIKEEIAKEIR